MAVSMIVESMQPCPTQKPCRPVADARAAKTEHSGGGLNVVVSGPSNCRVVEAKETVEDMIVDPGQ